MELLDILEDNFSNIPFARNWTKAIFNNTQWFFITVQTFANSSIKKFSILKTAEKIFSAWSCRRRYETEKKIVNIVNISISKRLKLRLIKRHTNMLHSWWAPCWWHFISLGSWKQSLFCCVYFLIHNT